MSAGTKENTAGNEGYLNRIVIKFHDHLQISRRYGSNIIHYLSENYRSWKSLFSAHPCLQINLLFTSVTPETIVAWVNKARQLDVSYQPPDLLSYYIVGFPQYLSPHEMLIELSGLEEIELVYVQSAISNPSTTEATSHSVLQKSYLNPSPEGIDALYAWSIKGGKGTSSIKFIDIEQGWMADHEAIDVKALPLTGINDPHFRDHGAAVLRVIMMRGSGIAPEVTGHIISQWRPDGMPNDADAVLAAINYLGFGDILLIEMQSYYSADNKKLWPAEIQEATFQAIRLATALGIIVIEAAGNGDYDTNTGNDLDLLSVNKKKVLNPERPGFRDSGAIIVAAATSDVPHCRISSSNFGKRINCYAWGDKVETLKGYYFNGTSSASAIIAGAAISIQSILETIQRARFNPNQMRDILSNERYGTASVNGHINDKIGVMPDLKKIIDHCLHDYADLE